MGVMEALYEQVPRIRAQRTLLAAEAAVYPHLTKEGGERWWRLWVGRAYPPARGSAAVPKQRRALFFWNGEPVTPRELKGRLAGHLRSGFSRD